MANSIVNWWGLDRYNFMGNKSKIAEMDHPNKEKMKEMQKKSKEIKQQMYRMNRSNGWVVKICTENICNGNLPSEFTEKNRK